jgi:hypothetical protein
MASSVKWDGAPLFSNIVVQLYSATPATTPTRSIVTRHTTLPHAQRRADGWQLTADSERASSHIIVTVQEEGILIVFLSSFYTSQVWGSITHMYHPQSAVYDLFNPFFGIIIIYMICFTVLQLIMSMMSYQNDSPVLRMLHYLMYEIRIYKYCCLVQAQHTLTHSHTAHHYIMY